MTVIRRTAHRAEGGHIGQLLDGTRIGLIGKLVMMLRYTVYEDMGL